MPHLNNSHTRITSNNKYHPTNIIKYKRGEAFYFFSNMVMGKAIDKKSNKEIDVVRFYFQRANDWEGDNKHDFKFGEVFTDRFEFVDFNSIPNGDAKDSVIHQIKKHNEDLDEFGFHTTAKGINVITYLHPQLCGVEINAYMNTIKKEHELSKQKVEDDKKPTFYAQLYGESDKDFDKRLKDTIDKCSIGIGDYNYETYVDSAKSYEDLRKLAEYYGQPIITAVQKTPKTIILKKHTHKKDNKIVINKSNIDLDKIKKEIDKRKNNYSNDLSHEYRDNAYIGGVDCATSNSNDVSVLIGNINAAANTISQHMTSPAADYVVTSQYVSDQLHNALGVPSNMLNRYADKQINQDLYGTITFGNGGKFNHDNDGMKILSKKDKKIDNKVCMLQDKLVIL